MMPTSFTRKQLNKFISGLSSLLGHLDLLGPSEIGFAFHGINLLSLEIFSSPRHPFTLSPYPSLYIPQSALRVLQLSPQSLVLLFAS